MEKNNKKNTEPARIQVTKTEEFGNTFDTKVTTFEELTKTINGLFSVFSDFAGCNIRVPGQGNPVISDFDESLKQTGMMYVDLYFKDMGEAPEGTIKNIIPVGSRKKDGNLSMFERYKTVTVDNQQSSRAYTVTKETYECLEEFMIDNNAKNKWEKYTRESQQQNGLYAKDGIMVVISGLSLEKILGTIYGTKTKDARYIYACALNFFDSINFQANYNSTANSKSIVTVTRLDENKLRKLIAETNTMYPGSFVPIR